MKHVSKFTWLVFGLVLIGGGCMVAGEEVVEEEAVMEVQVVEVTVDSNGQGMVEEVENEDAATEDVEGNIEEQETEETSNVVQEEVTAIDASFTMTAGNFFFEPSTMRVKAGDTVNVFFSENSGTHDLTIDEIGFSERVVDGGSMTFTAPSTPGSYAYYCSIGSHRALGMEGVLIVE